MLITWHIFPVSLIFPNSDRTPLCFHRPTHPTETTLGVLFKISFGKRLAIKNAFQRAYSTNLENISVHLVIEIEKFWKSNSSVVWEIKRDKFWKSKLSFQKSNASNFRNQKCNWEIKRDKLWKWKVSFEKSNATNLKSKPKVFFLLIVEKNIKIKENKKRIRHSTFYLWYSSNTVI